MIPLAADRDSLDHHVAGPLNRDPHVGVLHLEVVQVRAMPAAPDEDPRRRADRETPASAHEKPRDVDVGRGDREHGTLALAVEHGTGLPDHRHRRADRRSCRRTWPPGTVTVDPGAAVVDIAWTSTGTAPMPRGLCPRAPTMRRLPTTSRAAMRARTTALPRDRRGFVGLRARGGRSVLVGRARPSRTPSRTPSTLGPNVTRTPRRRTGTTAPRPATRPVVTFAPSSGRRRTG